MKCAKSADQRRNQRQKDSEIGDQCGESADQSYEIKVLDAEIPEDDAADDRRAEADDEVGEYVRADHPRDTANGTMRQQAVFFAEEADGADIHMLFGCEHEVNEKRNKAYRQNCVSDSCVFFGDDPGYTLWLLNLHGDWLLTGLGLDYGAGLIR